MGAKTRPRIALHQHAQELPHLIHVVARLPLRDRARENVARGRQGVHGARRDPPPVALLPDDPEIPELQTPAVADEDVQRCEVAVERLAAVQLSKHLEDTRDFASRGGLRPPLGGAGQEGAQVAVARVLEREAVQHLSVGAHQRKRVEDANRPRMSVQQLPEVRLAQPPVDARAHLDADDLGNDR